MGCLPPGRRAERPHRNAHLWLQEPQLLSRDQLSRGSNLTDYYENLRNNVMTLLEHVRIPSGCSGAVSGQAHLQGHLQGHLQAHLPYSDMRVGPEHFDSYLSKLQTLCEEGNGSNRGIYGTVRSTLPTPI